MVVFVEELLSGKDTRNDGLGAENLVPEYQVHVHHAEDHEDPEKEVMNHAGHLLRAKKGFTPGNPGAVLRKE